MGLSFFVVVKRTAALQVLSLLHFAMLEEKTSLMVTANQQPETSESKEKKILAIYRRLCFLARSILLGETLQSPKSNLEMMF